MLRKNDGYVRETGWSAYTLLPPSGQRQHYSGYKGARVLIG